MTIIQVKDYSKLSKRANVPAPAPSSTTQKKEVAVVEDVKEKKTKKTKKEGV